MTSVRHLLEDKKLCNALISEMVIELDQISFSVETQTRSQSLKKIDDLPTKFQNSYSLKLQKIFKTYNSQANVII